MIQLLDTNTVKLPISNHPKYKDLVIAYRRCLIMGVDKQDVSSKTRSWHIYLVEYSYFERGCRKKCARDNPER